MMYKQIILIVDDSPENIDLLVSVLSPEYETKAAINAKRAFDIARSQPQPDLILLDVVMPETDGYALCQMLKSDPSTSEIPVVFITAKSEAQNETYGLSLGAVDYICKPINPSIVSARVKTHLSLYDHNRNLQDTVKERTNELYNTQLKIIQKLGRAVEYRDNETGFHVIRMSHYARLIAQAYGGNRDWVERIFHAAPMHDVGKIGVPDSILLKPGKLDDEERAAMQRHCEFGAQIIGNDKDPLLQMSRAIALTHHEKWDGSGYPAGLKEKDIPLEGRIVAIADVFDALTSERPYKHAWSVEDAVELMKREAGKHFDPELIDMFMQVLPEILEIKERFKD